jgi:hypothetical protein
VWFRAVNGIVHPPTRLLNPNSSPFILSQKAILGKKLGNIGRKLNMPVLIGIVIVFLRILHLRHFTGLQTQSPTEAKTVKT